MIAFLDTFPSSDLRDMRNVSERFQYSGPLNYCYICYVRVQYRLISMQPKELQMIHDGGKKIVVFNSGKMKKISKCNSSRHAGNQRRIKTLYTDTRMFELKVRTLYSFRSGGEFISCPSRKSRTVNCH